MPRASRVLMPLYPDAILFQHKLLSLNEASFETVLLKSSVITNVMVSLPVQTEIVTKFTGSTGLDI